MGPLFLIYKRKTRLWLVKIVIVRHARVMNLVLSMDVSASVLVNLVKMDVAQKNETSKAI